MQALQTVTQSDNSGLNQEPYLAQLFTKLAEDQFIKIEADQALSQFIQSLRIVCLDMKGSKKQSLQGEARKVVGLSSQWQQEATEWHRAAE